MVHRPRLIENRALITIHCFNLSLEQFEEPEVACPNRAEFGTVPNRSARKHSARLAPYGCTHFEQLSENQALPTLCRHEQSLAEQMPYTRT